MKAGGIALLLSAVALGAAVFSLTTREKQQTQRAPVRMDRVAALEARVAELELKVRSVKSASRERTSGNASESDSGPGPAPLDESGTPIDVGDDDPKLTAIVDKAVDRKAKQVMDEMRVKENKKPSMDVFASVLELTEEQRAAAERVVLEGQKKVYEILETPTYDGVNLMDELVDIVAKGIAQPGKDHGWGPWVARVLGDKIPGTDETYGARVDSVKKSMRESFKRDWSAEQYREFEAWQMDPTEIRDVPGSPQKELEVRITERARALGAELPVEEK